MQNLSCVHEEKDTYIYDMWFKNIRICQKWFASFNSDDFNLEPNNDLGSRKSLEVKNLRYYSIKIYANCNKIDSLSVDSKAIKFGATRIYTGTSWKAFTTCEVLLQLHKRKLFCIVVILAMAMKNRSIANIQSEKNNGSSPENQENRWDIHYKVINSVYLVGSRFKRVWPTMSCWEADKPSMDHSADNKWYV